MKNSGRQPMLSMIGPPITRPVTAAADVVAEAHADALTLSPGGKHWKSMAYEAGTVAVPASWARVRLEINQAPLE